MKLRVKLLLGFVCLAAVAGVVGIMSIISSQRTTQEFDTVITLAVPRLQALLELSSVSSEINVLTKTFNAESIGPSSSEGSASAETKTLFLSQLSELTRLRDLYAKRVSPNDKNGQELLAAIIDAKNQVSVYGLELILSKEKNLDERIISERLARLNKASELLSRITNEAVNIEIDTLQYRNQTIGANSQQVISATLIFTLLAFSVSLTIGLLIANSIASRVTTLKNATKDIAEGNFEKPVEIKGQDEISQLAQTFNDMAGKLKELYRTLADEKAKDEALLANLAEGMIAVNNQGIVLKMNKVAQDIFELENPRIDTQIYECFTLFNPDGEVTPRAENPAIKALSTGQLMEGVFEIHLKDDSKRQVGILANPVKQSDEIIGVIMIIRDVTKERDVDRMKTEFISLASHQLRTPLSAIKWFSEMLINGDAGKLTDEQVEFTQNILESAGRMTDLVSSLLNISRIESGRIVIDPKPTDLRELVQGIVNDLKAKIEEKQQNLIISVHEDMPMINLDPRMIGQVYMNLLTNAIKYTPKGGDIQVFISKKDNEVISQVTDTGYGIPVKQQEKVFQKFFRAENVVKVETDGTGLGLYLIKAIVDSSGGKIWFKSEEGKGTTFWFSLPAEGMQAKKGEVTLD